MKERFQQKPHLHGLLCRPRRPAARQSAAAAPPSLLPAVPARPSWKQPQTRGCGSGTSGAPCEVQIGREVLREKLHVVSELRGARTSARLVAHRDKHTPVTLPPSISCATVPCMKLEH
jgi:hypothetical protein